MGANTKIEWTTHTFNPWRGCEKVSPGCANCYAEATSKRNPKVLGEWGPNGRRVIAAEGYWKKPEAWDGAAKRAGERHRVFCASLADVFEGRPELVKPRGRLLKLIKLTPNLDWLLLTKRPQDVLRLVEEVRDSGGEGREIASSWCNGCPPSNLWLGTSVEDQERADERIPWLLKAPAAIRFLSCEPLLGPLNLKGFLRPKTGDYGECLRCGFMDMTLGHARLCTGVIDWVIVGGESGRQARPCRRAWIEGLMHDCEAAGAACFVKQLGAAFSDETNGIAGVALQVPDEAAPLISLRLKDRKGGDMEEWPARLRVRQLPEVQP